ncbi:hypothetical protein C0Q70_09745 [Pomacea canaliculata]|uniref:UDENN domain-containing protein n=1 Tax=Pomacea canaliculata TaxID=400727 RepID=A0A2T7PAN6_POMCA|nr:hypothetical protein C0Q70_09745 [Pomacea canaliculata]
MLNWLFVSKILSKATMASEKETETPILHVEYSYPPVIAGTSVESHELPQQWKHLPSLALPDGAHNFLKDTVFFHLPGKGASEKTVYCVSCYRQIDAKDLLNRTADITRSTVQKSVCVISRLPLYGLIKAKLELITHAYFDERDFSKVELLEQTFNNLNASLTESLLSSSSQIFLGLSTRDLVARFKHRVIALFKLILLERRVLFFGSPVEELGGTILSLLSLFPGMLEFGLEQAVSHGGQRLVSPTMELASLDPSDNGTGEEFLEVRYHSSPQEETNPPLLEFVQGASVNCTGEEPESPTIPRDITLDLSSTQVQEAESSNLKARKNAENEQRKMSGKNIDHEQDKMSMESDGINHSHSSFLGISELEVHKTKRQSSIKDEASLSILNSSSSSDLPVASNTLQPELSSHMPEAVDIQFTTRDQSPLKDLKSIIQVQAVQTGRTLLSAQDVANHYDMEVQAPSMGSEVATGVTELAVCVAGTDPLMVRSDSFEELDSPESISKIDREDCFSWEQDNLHLALAVDNEDFLVSSHAHIHKSTDSVAQAEPSVANNQQNAYMEEQGTPSSDDGSQAAMPHDLSPSKHISGPLKNLQKKAGSPGRKTAVLRNKLSKSFGKVGSRTKDQDVNTVEMKPIVRGEVHLQQDDFGFPLAIFSKGYVCHPYLSLQFHSILNDVNVRGFVIGATNVLFRQQKHATDVIILTDECKVEIRDKDLQKQLHLTTADLRFAEYLVRVVTEEKHNILFDGTEWEGSDEWIRAQFRVYLQCLLSAMQQEDSKLLEDYGIPFISAWRTTHNYHHWLDTSPHPKMAEISAAHPYQGNFNVNDVRMKLNHTMQSSEKGRKLNAAVVQTGKYVMQTGKAVGGAFSSARSAVSSWFNSIASDWKHSDEEDEEGEEKDNKDTGSKDG